MYLALVFEISYSGRKIQKSVAWIMPHLDTGGEVEERLDLIQ
jgi:hypothetical protein